MSEVGRPKEKIDLDLVSSLCEIQCTGEEIASVLKVNYSTLKRRIQEEYDINFAQFYKKHSQVGKSSLRRMQWASASKGNVTMQIWLGKQYLGQRESVEVNDDTKDKLAELVETMKKVAESK